MPSVLVLMQQPSTAHSPTGVARIIEPAHRISEQTVSVRVIPQRLPLPHPIPSHTIPFLLFLRTYLLFSSLYFLRICCRASSCPFSYSPPFLPSRSTRGEERSQESRTHIRLSPVSGYARAQTLYPYDCASAARGRHALGRKGTSCEHQSEQPTQQRQRASLLSHSLPPTLVGQTLSLSVLAPCGCRTPGLLRRCSYGRKPW